MRRIESFLCPSLNPSLYLQTPCIPIPTLRQLLLDEESPQIRQLPRTSERQHNTLYHRPPHNPRVNTLALIPKLHLPLSLEDLLPPHVLQPRVQISHFLHHFSNLILVTAFDLRGLADCEIKLELDPADLRAGEEEAGGCGDVGRGEADAVLAGVGGGEGEFAEPGAALGDDAVVAVEDFVDGDEDALNVVC